MSIVKPLPLNDANFLKRVRSVAGDTERIQLGPHARRRMRERRISLRQVIECLRRGRIDEPASVTLRGDWKATLIHQCAGDTVRVAVALRKKDDGDFAVVITVIGE